MKTYKDIARLRRLRLLMWWTHLVLSVVCVRFGWTQVLHWEIGSDGVAWDAQADQVVGAVTVDGGLQPLRLVEGVNLTQTLAEFDRPWQNGAPADYTQGGLPRAWSNSSFFDGLQGPLRLVDGDPQTSTENIFKAAGSPAGTAFFFDLGAVFPIERVRFYTAPDDQDSYMRAYELMYNDGDNFDPSRRPYYTSLRRVEANRNPQVDIEFELLNVRFIQLRNLSRSVFNLAEVEIYGQGFIPEARYESNIYRFDTPVNLGKLLVEAERLGEDPVGATEAAEVYIQVRNGADDTPWNYFRLDRELGTEEEVSPAEYENQLPRLAYFRKDRHTGEPVEEVSRAAYLALPVDEQGPIRDFIRGSVRIDTKNWSSWSAPIRVDDTGAFQFPLDLPGPRQYVQFRVSFDGDHQRAMRLNRLEFEYSPLLADSAVGELALVDDPSPAAGFTSVPSAIDTSFVLDVHAVFDSEGLEGYNGISVGSFPPPVFVGIEWGDPPTPIGEYQLYPTDTGFSVFFPPIEKANNRIVRIYYRHRLLEHNTPVEVLLLGAEGGIAQPVAAGNASRHIHTNALHVYTLDYQPSLTLNVSTNVLSPNGDGLNEFMEFEYSLTHFTSDIRVDIEIFDLAGQRVRRLHSAPVSTGVHRHQWDGRDDDGKLVPPGNYVCRIAATAQAKSFVMTRLIGVVY